MNTTYAHNPSLSSAFWRMAMTVLCSISPSAARSISQLAQQRRFDALISAHSSLISRICFSYASDGADYEDLRQDVMINIWKGLENFREESSSVTWIYRIALNTCVSTLRKRSRRPLTERLDSMPIDLPADSGDDSMRERLEILYKLISQLSPVDKAIVTMWLDDRSYDEIAEVIGMTKGNITLRMHRIRERWRVQLTNRKTDI